MSPVREERTRSPSSPRWALARCGRSRPRAWPAVPCDIAVSPQGTSAYAVDDLSPTAGAVSQYTLNPATGKLTPKSPGMVATAGVPSGLIAISPDGKNAYVPSGKAISEYQISDGRYLYFVRHELQGAEGRQGQQVHRPRQASTVSVFGISPAAGALSVRPVQTVATGLGPQMITIAPDGTSAYVAATGANTIRQYSIDPATGKLTPKSPAMVAGGVPRTTWRSRRTARTCMSST